MLVEYETFDLDRTVVIGIRDPSKSRFFDGEGLDIEVRFVLFLRVEAFFVVVALDIEVLSVLLVLAVHYVDGLFN